ncbi:MAG TPA: M15 family metallopeptidase [Longimicrobium sp.]|nr:M15 family metallopeptidase [Longimicrobium sp.]
MPGERISRASSRRLHRPHLTALSLAAVLAACVPPASPATGPGAPEPDPSVPRPATAAVDEECRIPAGMLVDVRSVDPGIRVDVRYATANNFTGAVLPGYEKPLALLRPEAARALARVHRRLRAQGYGLKVFDGYRPIRATLGMVAWAERTGNEWVLEQGYVARQSGHNRGATVDLTLVRLSDGAEVDMGTPYDTFSEAAHTANATGAVMENRLRLLRAMEAEGFSNYDKEWWHFRLPGDPAALDVPLRCF